MDGAVAEVHVVRLGQIALTLAVAGKALRLRQALLELCPHGRGEGHSSISTLIAIWAVPARPGGGRSVSPALS